MDPAIAIVTVILGITFSILIYNLVDRIYPQPPEKEKTDFEILMDTIDLELARLHEELNSVSGIDYRNPLIDEIRRLNDVLDKVEIDNVTTENQEQVDKL